MIKCVASLWTCSKSEVLDTIGQHLKFCGFNICRTKNGYRPSQEAYVVNLCAKKGISKGTPWKGVGLGPGEDEDFDNPTLRGLVGELQWMGT